MAAAAFLPAAASFSAKTRQCLVAWIRSQPGPTPAAWISRSTEPGVAHAGQAPSGGQANLAVLDRSPGPRSAGIDSRSPIWPRAWTMFSLHAPFAWGSAARSGGAAPSRMATRAMAAGR